MAGFAIGRARGGGWEAAGTGTGAGAGDGDGAGECDGVGPGTGMGMGTVSGTWGTATGTGPPLRPELPYRASNPAIEATWLSMKSGEWRFAVSFQSPRNLNKKRRRGKAAACAGLPCW